MLLYGYAVDKFYFFEFVAKKCFSVAHIGPYYRTQCQWLFCDRKVIIIIVLSIIVLSDLLYLKVY